MINVIFSIVLAGSQMLASPTAIQTMMLAEGYMNAGQIELAIETFNKALASDELNDLAKISIYWNLHICYDTLKKYDDAGESLMAFVLSSEGLIEWASDINRPENPVHIFIAQIKLKNKIAYAKTLLEIYWYKHNPNNCKTKESACALPMQQLFGLYAVRLPFCGDTKKIQDVQRVPGQPIQIKVKCEGSEEVYYFQ